jgi:hypothetical protein
LTDFVPPDGQVAVVPCHHIPLNEAGETVEDLEMGDNQHKLEESVKSWLRVKIKEIEDVRA